MASASTLSGIDWLSCTTKSDEVGLEWSHILHKRKGQNGATGFDIKEWRNKYYQGVNVAGLSWGYSERSGYIMIAQGSVAQEYWQKLLPNAARVTRLDLQCTALLVEQDRLLAMRAYTKAKEIKGRGYSLVQNSQDGQTVYVGSRNSDQFGRLYDKGVKSGMWKPGNFWRYEVEIKKPRADVLAKSLLAANAQGEDMDIPIKTYVWNWFNARGIQPKYSPGDNGLLAEVGKRVTTTDRKLAWLRTQVRPTLLRLIEEGYGDGAALALGIDERVVKQMGLFADEEK